MVERRNRYRQRLSDLPEWLLDQPSSISGHPLMSPMTIREELELRSKFESDEDFGAHLAHVSYLYECSLSKEKPRPKSFWEQLKEWWNRLRGKN